MTGPDAVPMMWHRTRVQADTAELQQLGAFLRDALAAQMQPTPDLAMRVELVAVELFTNAVRHGSAARISVGLGARPDDVLVRIEYDGTPFDVGAVEPGALGELREGGYGLAIVHELAQLTSGPYRDGLNRIDARVPILRDGA
jgi:anti-sigma regulatory factor (Ser/Thr protein kinase)